ncbi:hypothetical protein [Polaromonas sp.]|uniref:hypothetical protein n=1 Tax=Polaromonas sp. TaxID=1869339 RepID=UPI003265F8F2
MPITIQLEQVIACAKSLDSGHVFTLVTGVTARLAAGALAIEENGNIVFHMKVKKEGSNLILDYPRTQDEEQGRGWARLGLLLALRYGLHMGCTTAAAGTQLETNSYSFWVPAGLQFSLKSSLQQSIIKVMLLIQRSSPQPYPPGTSVIVIRDPVHSVTESKVTVRKRSGSYHG